MMLLSGCTVLALDQAADSALARLLSSFGARVTAIANSELQPLLASADFLIEQSGLPYFAQHTRLIHVSVTPFGSTGPRATWRGSELIASAMGGVLRLTGDVDRAPVKEALDACWFHADMVAAAGALAALHERIDSGRGQHIDVSVQEVAFTRNVNSILAWQFDRRTMQRAGAALNYGRATVRCIWPLKDGYCFHSLMTGRFGAPANQALSDWMDQVGVDNPLRGVDWLAYNRSTLNVDTRARWEAAIENFFRTRTKAEINADGLRRGINATVVAEPADVLEDAHLQSRRFWEAWEAAETANANSESLAPAGLIRDAAHGPQHGPQQQSNTPSRFVSIALSANAAPAPRRTSARPGPLAGIRVLDFSWALVGSFTTKTLGDLGADVVKVESRTRPCLSRIDVQVQASRADSFDDKPWFAHMNTSKQSLALDMKHAASREVIDPLIEWADVVVENFSPGTMHKLGLDYAQLAKRNPNVIMASGSVFGQTGPLAQTWGVDGTGAALSGRTYLTGWPDRDPAIPSAAPYGDVIVPYVMAAAISAALAQRRATGRGCHIDASMYEICVQQMMNAIASARRGERPMRQGNRDTRLFHQGVYPALGHDRWVAITLHTERDWQTLRRHAQLQESPSADARDAVIAAWTRTRVDAEIVDQLQAWQIAAGVAQDIENMMSDPQLRFRQALLQLDHAVLSPFEHVRTPISFSRSVIAPYRAPSIGEHNKRIAAELCGLDAARIVALETSGIFR